MLSTEQKLQSEIEELKRRVRDLERALGRANFAWLGGGITLDYLFVGVKKVTIPAMTTDFLNIMLDGSGASWVAAMPETQASDSVTIDVTKNRIYFSGEFGGG